VCVDDAPAAKASFNVEASPDQDAVEISSFKFNSKSQIEFITDVEGHWEYFLRFIDRSSILYWDGEDRGAWGPGLLRLRRQGVLVFGGDAPDKGPGDIRFIKTLLSLRKRFPNQVYFILGNRDLMKLRFMAELKEIEEPGMVWTPSWDRKAISFEQFLEDRKGENIQRDLIGKLKWLLHCTMGCQDTTFSTRKSELALLRGRASDQDVLESYVSSVDPRSADPWMFEFISLGQIGLVLDSALFVHGGLRDENLGCIPGHSERWDDVQEWVDHLNAWKDQQLAEYVSKPYFYTENGVRKRGGETLIEYGTPGGGKETVIYVNPFKDGNPQQRSEKVQDYLERSGIRRVFSGHQPHGQTPTVVRHPRHGLLWITADTSRSDSTASKLFNPADNRGSAMSIVRVYSESVEIEGTLVDGRQHRCLVHNNPAKDRLPDALVGRQLNDGSWVKTIVFPSTPPEGETESVPRLVHDVKLVQTALGKGFNVKVSDLREHTACLLLRDEFKTRDIFRVSVRDFQASSKSQTGLEDCRDADLTSYSIQEERDFSLDSPEFYAQHTFIFSLMGVIMDPKTELGGRIVEKVNDLIFRGKRIIFITNNSNKTRSGLMEELEQNYRIKVLHTAMSQSLSPDAWRKPKEKSPAMVKITHQHIVTSANTCAWFLKQKGIERPFVICSSLALCEELDAFGISHYTATIHKDGKPKQEYLQEVTDKRICDLIAKAPEVDAVVVGWDQHFTALKAAVAAQYVKWSQENGTELPVISCSMDRSGILGLSPDSFCQSQGFNSRKIRAFGNGAMATAIQQCIGIEEVVDVGKPSLMLLEQLRRSSDEGGLGVNFSKAVVIGSTLDTDIELANSGGMKSLLVLSGVTSRSEVMREKNPMRIPTWVAESLAEV